MNLKATKGNVFVDPIQEKWSDTILTPESIRQSADIPHMGRVVAIGGKAITRKGVVLEPEFKVGDKVVIRKYTATFIPWEGRQLLQVKHHEVLAVVEES